MALAHAMLAISVPIVSWSMTATMSIAAMALAQTEYAIVTQAGWEPTATPKILAMVSHVSMVPAIAMALAIARSAMKGRIATLKSMPNVMEIIPCTKLVLLAEAMLATTFMFSPAGGRELQFVSALQDYGDSPPPLRMASLNKMEDRS